MPLLCSSYVSMTHVITASCVDHKYQDCVSVCPVEAFREAENYLVIDPDECIDCAACEPVCPVDAIFPDDEVPDNESQFIEEAQKYDYDSSEPGLNT